MNPEYTMYHFLQQTASSFADRPAARTRVGKEWKEYKYSEWYQWIQELSLGLIDLGVKPQDKIVHIADNRVEWMVVSLAITSIGCVDVPRGTDATFEDLSYIINHVEAEILILENEKVYKKLQQNLGDFKNLKTLIVIEGKLPEVPGMATHTLEEIRERGKKSMAANGDAEFHNRGKAIKPDDLVSVIYTSGTTGTPKGVMLTNHSLVWENRAAHDVLKLNSSDSTMCFLPPWHIAERLLEMLMVSVGGCMNFTNVANIVNDMATHKPTVILAVPRVWEGIYKKIHDNVAKASPIARSLFNFSKWIAQHYTMAGQYLGGRVAYSEPPPAGETLKKAGYLFMLPTLWFYNLPAQAILGKIRKLVGGNAKFGFSGAGALPHNVDLFFRSCGIPIVEAYGMTETTGVSTFRKPEKNKFQTLGVTLNGIEVQLRTEKGEVITKAGEKGIAWHKGPNIMKGYYKEEEKTKATIDENGYLNSGDLLVMTTTGEFRFAGRAKDTIVLLGGENLEPVPIEDKLKESPLVSQVMIVGQDRKTLGALITPNVEGVTKWADSNGVKLGDDQSKWNENADLRNAYKVEIKNLISTGNGFKSFEKVSNFHVLPKEFEAGDEMTQTMKIKRNVVTDKYEKEIAALYGE